MTVEIKSAYDDIDVVRELFMEYTAMLGVNLDFQGYDEELAGLPGKYAPPDGRLFLAVVDGRVAGCVALRSHDAERCEMKRLFVRPEFRGRGAGRALAERALAEGEAMGYRAIILDTQKRLERSLALYLKLGFTEIAPYYHNPYPDVVYLGLELFRT